MREMAEISLPDAPAAQVTLTRDRCSTADLLQAYDGMAIPHFQRGLVWDDSSVALLLESLFFETHVGRSCSGNRIRSHRQAFRSEPHPNT